VADFSVLHKAGKLAHLNMNISTTIANNKEFQGNSPDEEAKKSFYKITDSGQGSTQNPCILTKDSVAIG